MMKAEQRFTLVYTFKLNFSTRTVFKRSPSNEVNRRSRAFAESAKLAVPMKHVHVLEVENQFGNTNFVYKTIL